MLLVVPRTPEPHHITHTYICNCRETVLFVFNSYGMVLFVCCYYAESEF